MNIDSFTRAADTHSNTGVPNQDAYAVRTHLESVSIAVSDGCSSMPESQYTSMDLARKAVSCGTSEELLDLNFSEIRHEAHGHATLMWANINKSTTTIVMMGDGAWGFKKHEDIFACSVDWNDIPPYPTYDIDLLNKWPGHSELTQIGDIPEAIRIGTAYIWTIPTDFDQLWISSDGVLKVASLDIVANEMTALKNASGQFIKRRMARWLRNSFMLDDLTVVSIVNGVEHEHACVG